MRNHSKLTAFHSAHRLVLLVYRVTKSFPDREKFGLTSQMRRAAMSIPSNIVEGCARESEREYFRFLTIAYGSSCELQYQVQLAGDLGYLPDSARALSESACIEVSKMLNGLLASLRSCPEPREPKAYLRKEKARKAGLSNTAFCRFRLQILLVSDIRHTAINVVELI